MSIWKAWRAENRPPHRGEWDRWTKEERGAYEDRLAAATQLTFALVPHDQAALLSLAADERVWNAGSDSSDETIEGAIRGCIEWLIAMQSEAFDKSVYGGS